MKQNNYEWYDSKRNTIVYGDEAYQLITKELVLIIDKKNKLFNTINQILELVNNTDNVKDNEYEYLIELGEAISTSEILIKTYLDNQGGDNL